MNELKTSIAQLEATRRYREKLKKQNPDKVKHDNLRRQAKSYIKNWADNEELIELETWINQKRKGEEIK